MKKPSYYVAVFGKPGPPDKGTADSGIYHLGVRGTDTPGERGDILLIYCTADDAANLFSVPGIGIVLTKTRESIFYRYLPFTSPISKDKIESTFTDEDRGKFVDIKFNTYWLFAISNESFRNATKGLMINWP